MAERLKAHDWKSCDGETRSEVRILFSAPQKNAPIRVCSIEIFLLWEVVRHKTVPLPFSFKRFAGLLPLRCRIFLLLVFFYHPTFPLGVRQPYQ